MDRKKWETLVLVIGVIVVAAALGLIFLAKDNPQSSLYTNITFAVGFLFYIIYNMISTGGLQKELRDYQSQVSALKEEIGNSASRLSLCRVRCKKKTKPLAVRIRKLAL